MKIVTTMGPSEFIPHLSIARLKLDPTTRCETPGEGTTSMLDDCLLALRLSSSPHGTAANVIQTILTRQDSFESGGSQRGPQ